MKCQKCENQATFFYSRNINGDVTETHLCEKCAEKEGYSFDGFFSSTRFVNMRRLFDDFDEMLTAPRMFSGFPLIGGFNGGGRNERAPRRIAQPRAETVTADTSVDESINARRQINVLREKMRMAADAEDFETAARLRDEIKAIEGGI